MTASDLETGRQDLLGCPKINTYRVERRRAASQHEMVSLRSSKFLDKVQAFWGTSVDILAIDSEMEERIGASS